MMVESFFFPFFFLMIQFACQNKLNNFIYFEKEKWADGGR
jgi:hypothetical protein